MSGTGELQKRIADLEAERDGLAASLRKARAQLEYIRAFIGWVPSDAERVRREHDAVIESLADPSAILAAHDRRVREQVIDALLEQFPETPIGDNFSLFRSMERKRFRAALRAAKEAKEKKDE
jgi:hypothetical protein